MNGETSTTLHGIRKRPSWCLFLKYGIVLVWMAAQAAAQVTSDSAQIAIFLQRDVSTDDAVRIPIDNMTLISPSGEREVPLRWPDLSTERKRADQEMLSTMTVAPGPYNRLSIRFGEVQATFAGEKITLSPDPQQIEVDLGLRLTEGEAAAVLLVWTPLTGEAPDSAYQIRLRRTDSAIPPLGSMAFVSNSGSNNIAILDRFAQRVVDIIPGGHHPMGLAYSRDKQQLFVAATEDDRILVYDIPQRHLVRQIALAAGDEPTRLLIGSRNDQLYVLNRGANSLSMIDLESYQEISRQVLGDSPVAMVLDETTGRLFIASNNTQEIAIYDPSSQTLELTYSTAGAPGEMVINSLDGFIISAIESQRVLLVLDSQSGIQQAILTLCSEAVGLAQNTTTRQVFASLGRCREIGIFRPEDELNLGRIRVSDDPGLIALDPENRRLLVTIPNSDRVAFININSKRTEGEIEVGDEPYMVIFPD